MTLEEKATAYAEKIFSEILNKYQTAPWNEFRDALAEIYLAGAREALAGQWRSGDEPPKHNHIVFVISDADDSELRHTTAYYQDGIWCFPDEWYYDCKVLKWMEPPKDESE
ncbi:MAG: hypothetical protein K2M59_06255 [Muribaculaceae bacterium]|nr:hypothetical protein [Muribaculaceae bacterium]